MLLLRAGENDDGHVLHDAIGERHGLRLTEQSRRYRGIRHRRIPIPAGKSARDLLRRNAMRSDEHVRALAELRNDGDRQMARIGHRVSEDRKRHRRRVKGRRIVGG